MEDVSGYDKDKATILVTLYTVKPDVVALFVDDIYP